MFAGKKKAIEINSLMRVCLHQHHPNLITHGRQGLWPEWATLTIDYWGRGQCIYGLTFLDFLLHIALLNN